MNLNKLDIKKSCTGSFLFIGGFGLALIGLAIGWLAWDWHTGVIVGLTIGSTFLIVSAITFLSIENPGAIAASLPLAASVLVNQGPNLPGPIDNVIIQLIGSGLSYFMWKRRDDRFPTWAIIPLAAAALYPLLGEFIPGSLDELLVTLGAVAILIITDHRLNRKKDRDHLLSAENNDKDQPAEGVTDIADEIPPTLPDSVNRSIKETKELGDENSSRIAQSRRH